MEQLEKEDGQWEQRIAGRLGNMDIQVGFPSIYCFDLISDLFFTFIFGAGLILFAFVLANIFLIWSHIFVFILANNFLSWSHFL